MECNIIRWANIKFLINFLLNFSETNFSFFACLCNGVSQSRGRGWGFTSNISNQCADYIQLKVFGICWVACVIFFFLGGGGYLIFLEGMCVFLKVFFLYVFGFYYFVFNIHSLIYTIFDMYLVEV